MAPLLRNGLWLLVWLGVCFAVAGVGGAITASSVNDWYPTLRRPPIAPPDWVFGPVWTVLYALMAVAAWRVWLVREPAFQHPRRLAIGLFILQLAFNLGWSLLFFGLRQITAAAVEIVLLWLLILATILQFFRVDRVAAALMLPYLAWVLYAVLLTVWIAVLNGG